MTRPVNITSLGEIGRMKFSPGRRENKVAIIGLGYIGGAQERMFRSAGYVCTGYDVVTGRPYPAEWIAECDFAVVCVGTPQDADGRADVSQVDLSIARLPASMPVLLRSTVPPGTTQRLLAERGAWGDGVIAHAPEFMHERPGGAWRDSDDVPFLILGGDQRAQEFFQPHLGRIFRKIHACAALTAELAKYTVNLHLATRVTFINEMDAVCRAVGADWEDVRQAWLNDPRITPEYTGGIAEFGPGFGGRCWPKDLEALIASAEDHGYDPEFLKAVRLANGRFRG